MATSMAADLDDGEFWLPSQFLTDDDVGEEDDGGNMGFEFGFQKEFLYGDSDLSSPGEAVPEKSDDDDYLIGLARKVAYSTLEDSSFQYNSSKALGLSSSPESTLFGALGSRGSTNCSSRTSSPPPELPGKADGVSWDLLYAAAGDVAKMKMMEESSAGIYPSENGIWAPPRKPTHFRPANSNQLPHQSNFQMANFQHKIQNQRRNGRVGLVPSMNTPQPNMPSWPTLQQSVQQPRGGSGMRAVFIGNPAAAKRECAGTGVFLPRTAGNAVQSSKKPVCSTVLLPEKVVQALNLNLESQLNQPRYGPRFTHNHVGMGSKTERNNVRVWPQQRRDLRPSPADTVGQELRLPQEWTY